MVCGHAGAFCMQPVLFMGDIINYQGVFCRECQTKLAGATRFLVAMKLGGVEITPIDEENRPLLRRLQ